MKAKEILPQLSLKEKVLLLQAKDNWNLNGVKRFEVPEIYVTDGPNGVRAGNSDLTESYPATAIPAESILSASWDTDLVEELGEMLAEEARYYNVGVLLGPGVNAKRSPLAGRNFEYYSEDPYLSGKLAAALIRGVQKGGVGASLKHFAANDQETRRFTSNATVDERTLRELLLLPFEIAVREGDPWSIMGAYPKLRGTHACENPYLLKDILRDEWGYEGVVLTDWGACVNKVASHKNGLDLETGTFERAGELLRAVENGDITEAEIDLHALRVLELIEKAVEGRKKSYTVDWDRHHGLAKKAAGESIVLLKNEQRLLPLTEGCRIAVVGRFAEEPRFGGGGSSGVLPRKIDTLLNSLAGMAEISYAPGYDSEEPNAELEAEACRIAAGKEAVIIMVGTTAVSESEGADRRNLSLPESHLSLLAALAGVNPNIIVCNCSGAAVELGPVDSIAKSVLHCGFSGEAGGAALADILFGKVNPSGKLTETFPLRLEHTPAYPYFPGDGDEITYAEGLLQGYRYYDTKKIPVQYPFGHGLSYTDYKYNNLRFSDSILHNGKELTVCVDVTNTGEMEGTEIVEIYVSDPESYLVRPEKELKGFARVTLKPGETKTVSVVLDERAFSYYVPHIGRYAVESGIFRIMAAASAQDIRLEGEIRFVSGDEVRRPLTPASTMMEFYTDDRYAKETQAVYSELGIGEEHPMFPVLSSMRLEYLPGVLSFIQVPKEVSVSYQKRILSAVRNSEE